MLPSLGETQNLELAASGVRRHDRAGICQTLIPLRLAIRTTTPPHLAVRVSA